MTSTHWRARPAVIGEQLLQRLADQTWLDRPSYRIEHTLQLTLNLLGDAKRPVTNLLHGTVLGHPLHALLTDVPVGAWSAAVALDATDALTAQGRGAGYRQATRHTIGVGLVGAGASMVAGLMDWQYTQGDARRVGMVHGAVNLIATSCFAGSWIGRGRGRERYGRGTSAAGYLVLMAGGCLGGDLVSRLRIGVDHADRRLRPQRFTTALPDDQLPEQQPVQADVDGMSIVLVRSAGRVHALGQQCAHLGGPLERGWLQGETLVCPWHGSAFDLSTGRPHRGPATCQQPVFETRVVDGQIHVRCRPSSPDAPPGSVVAGEQKGEISDAGN